MAARTMSRLNSDRGTPLAASLALSASLGAVVLGAIAGCEPDGPKDHETLTIAGPKATKTFKLKLALNDKERAQGLGGVAELPEDGGMLFIFANQESRYFWMRGCTIDLDIAFLDGLGVVTAVHTMKKEAPQGKDESEQAYGSRLTKYNSGTPCQFAIEVRPGTFDTLGIKRGTKIQLDLARLKALAK